MFGLNVSSEIFQNSIRKEVHDILGITNKSYDITVHIGKLQEHYDSVHKLFGCLGNAGLTVNWEKIQARLNLYLMDTS